MYLESKSFTSINGSKSSRYLYFPALQVLCIQDGEEGRIGWKLGQFRSKSTQIHPDSPDLEPFIMKCVSLLIDATYNAKCFVRYQSVF